MAISELELELVCSGQDGSAAGAVLSTTTVTGQVKAIHLERTPGGENEAMPDTNTVLVKAVGPPDATLLNVKGEIVDRVYSPKTAIHHVDGNPILYEGTAAAGDDFSLVGGKIQVEANNANNGDRITVRVRYG